MLLQDDRISGVALVHCICDITDEGDQTDDKVNDHIDHHHGTQARWKTTLDSFTVLHHHHRQCSVASIANAVAESARKSTNRRAH